jgi:4'-phosphopantetheinyl transferase
MHDAAFNGEGRSSSFPVNELPFLSKAERTTYEGLRIEKRRREWLLGRWTAKQLLRRSRIAYANVPLTAITVGRDTDGAPYLAVETNQGDPGRLSLCLSISHRGEKAFCAISDTQIIGADIEHVEARHPAFVHDFFTASENAHVWASPTATRDTLITVIWSAKESALKVLREGLRLDTRCVEITRVDGIEAGSKIGKHVAPAREWHPIQMQCTLPNAPRFAAWWRPDGGDVLTLAMALAPYEQEAAAQGSTMGPPVSITQCALASGTGFE